MPELPKFFDDSQILRFSQMSINELQDDDEYKASYLHVPSKRPRANSYAGCTSSATKNLATGGTSGGLRSPCEGEAVEPFFGNQRREGE
jgi:hypothetical protein